MRQYTIAFSIFLSLFVSHFALAAPVAVKETVEVRFDPVQALNLNDEVATSTWEKEKRMAPNNKVQSSTNDVLMPDGGAPGGVQEGVDVGGVKGNDRFLTGPIRFPGSFVLHPGTSHNNPGNNPPKDVSDDDGGGGGMSAENMIPDSQSEHPMKPIGPNGPVGPIMAILSKWIKGRGPRIF